MDDGCIFCHVRRIVEMWRTELAKSNEKAAESIASPTEYENLFPELSQTLQAEKVRRHASFMHCARIDPMI